MSEQQKKELENAMNLQAEAQAAEARGQQPAMEKAEEKAEEIAASMGEDTVYNFVHPNNAGMIAFLRSKGYTVLNMIEIRKPYRDETLTSKIEVGNESFDY